jgi:hypothetical protein
MAVVLVAACSSPALPDATEVGANVVALDVFDGELYWLELDARLSLHGPAGQLWDGPYPFDRRAYYLVAGEQSVVMSSVNPFENCGDTIWIRSDGSAETLPLIEGGGCSAQPFDVAYGRVLYEVGRSGFVVEQFDFATRTIEPGFSTSGTRMWAYEKTATEVFAIGNDTTGPRQAIFAFPRESPTSRRVIVHDTDVAVALALIDDDVYWVHGGERGIVERAPQSATDAEPETLAQLDVEIGAMAAVDGALWLVPRSRSELWRLDLDGSVTRYDVPYVPLSLEAVGGQLAATTTDDPRRLLLQPVD